MSFTRARRPEQKEQRRAAILAATRELLAEQPLDAISLSAIARAAGVSKVSTYRYFESREAILLELLHERSEHMVGELEQALARVNAGAGPDIVGPILARVLIDHPDFVRLFSAVSTVLERNVSVDAIRAFKRKITARLLRPINALHASLPELSLADARRALTHILMHASGLWPATHPPEHVAAVMGEPEFEGLALDYEATLADHATLILRALLSP